MVAQVIQHKIGSVVLVAEQAPQHMTAVLIAVSLAMAIIVLVDKYERMR